MSHFITSIQVTLLITFTAAYAYTNKPPLCQVKVAPQLGIAPVTYLRVTATIEPNPDWREADVALYDDFSQVRSSTVFSGDPPFRRTTQIEWKSLSLDTNDYEVRLRVVGIASTRC